MAHIDDDRVVARGALCHGNALEPLEKTMIVVFVGGMVAGKARRIDARGPLQVIHLEPRIVGYCRSLGNTRRVSSLDQGVLDKG